MLTLSPVGHSEDSVNLPHIQLSGITKVFCSFLFEELLSQDSSDLRLGPLWLQDSCCYSGPHVQTKQSPKGRGALALLVALQE